MVKRAGGALLQSIAIDPSSTRTISSQLSAALRDLMLSGSLKAGDRLPASRTLAGELGVARATVVELFEQLASEGLMEARVGAGSFVSHALNAEWPARASVRRGAGQRSERLARLMTVAAGRFIDRLPHEPRAFTTAMPAIDAFPMAQWSRLAAKHWRNPRQSVLGYGDPRGHPALRRAIARHLHADRGVACEVAQVFVVAGAQQAFQLIASLLVDPGDKVWFEEPGTIGARNSLVLNGADLVPVPVDAEGMNVAEGMKRAPRFRLAFVTPSHQQPLGVKLSLERRFALLQAAQRAQAWIIEDDWDGEFCFGGRPLPTLRSFDATGCVIYVGTFSKSIFPSLRLGFILAPATLIQSFERALTAVAPGVPTSLQAILADFMEEGLFAAHIRRMRRLYAERHDALLEAARNKLGRWLDVVPTDTGLHTIGWLRQGLIGAEVSDAADRRGITLAPISRFCLEPNCAEGLVVGFSGITPALIRRGVDDLVAVFQSLPDRRKQPG